MMEYKRSIRMILAILLSVVSTIVLAMVICGMPVPRELQAVQAVAFMLNFLNYIFMR